MATGVQKEEDHRLTTEQHRRYCLRRKYQRALRKVRAARKELAKVKREKRDDNKRVQSLVRRVHGGRLPGGRDDQGTTGEGTPEVV